MGILIYTVESNTDLDDVSGWKLGFYFVSVSFLEFLSATYAVYLVYFIVEFFGRVGLKMGFFIE